MEINKKDIIDEIISLEPELNKDRKKLENILENIINIKPNVKISSEFKHQLKQNLLGQIRGNSYLKSNTKYSSLKYILSFIFGGVTAFSLVGILGINLDLLNINKDGNIGGIENMKIQENLEPNLLRAIPMGAEIGIMKKGLNNDLESYNESEAFGSMMMEENLLDEEVNEIESVMMMDSQVFEEDNDLILELRNYLEKIGIDNKIIEEILNIIKKYK